MIGLSLSFCVKDIIEGRVKLSEVDCIVSGTSIGGPPEMEEVIRSYQRSYWYNKPHLAEAVAWQLYHTRRIHQPRLTKREAPKVAFGHWIPLTVEEAAQLHGMPVFRTDRLLSAAEERIAENALAQAYWMYDLNRPEDRCNWD